MDLEGKTVLVTGASAGIGLEASVKIARMGAKVVLVARNPERTRAAVDEVKRRSGSDRVSSLLCDFGSQRQVRALAETFLATHDRLDVLVNNAGILSERHQLTEDGIEVTFAVNHLGYFLLTELLLDLRRARAGAVLLEQEDQLTLERLRRRALPEQQTTLAQLAAHERSPLSRRAHGVTGFFAQQQDGHARATRLETHPSQHFAGVTRRQRRCEQEKGKLSALEQRQRVLDAVRELQPRPQAVQHGLDGEQAIAGLGQGEDLLPELHGTRLELEIDGGIADGADQRRLD
jgi:hypothetical protein